MNTFNEPLVYGQYNEYPQQTYIAPTVQYNTGFAQTTTHQPYVDQSAYLPRPLNFTHTPCLVTCSNCHQQIMTSISRETGSLNWLVCIGLFFFGLICGCCLIPLFIDELKDTVHTCPNCGYLLCKRTRL